MRGFVEVDLNARGGSTRPYDLGGARAARHAVIPPNPNLNTLSQLGPLRSSRLRLSTAIHLFTVIENTAAARDIVLAPEW